MKKILTFLSSESGMAMPMVITIVTAAVSSIAYIIITLLPQLQDEQKKAQDAINYKIFITSLNDYVIHGMREKWCVNNISNAGGVVETDLLLSNDCSSAQTMEHIVTFPGNLERILWTPETYGQDEDPAGKNTIIGLHKAGLTPPAPVTLTAAQIKTDEIKLQLSQNVLLNMTDEHPLYIITKNIRSCVESVDISIKKMPDSTGEEVKIVLNIVGNISSSKVSCLASIKNLSSTAYYTFYPRRLHTYSLIKYDDLKVNMFHEYHSPVYVAGNLELPVNTFNKDISSIFYDSLTLGIYNSGVSGGRYEAGKIKTSDGDNYTFEERGHPYLSKQDNYPSFRGLIGGLRLDASEDKGMFNLFTAGAASASDVGQLEECIEENQVKTKPSYTAGTVIAYQNPSTTGAAIGLRVGLTKKNRFKPTINAPQEINPTADSPAKKFLVNVTSTSGTHEIGDFKVIINSDNTYKFSTAPNSPAELKVDFSKYGLTDAILDPAIATLNAVITKDNYQTILPMGHILNDLPQMTTFLNKANAFKLLCEVPLAATAECDDFLIPQTCISPACLDYSSAKNAMITAQNNLKNKIQQIKTSVSTPAKIMFSVSDVIDPGNSKIRINQKDLNITFSSNWSDIITVIKPTLNNDMFIEFTPYHYSNDDIKTVFFHDLDNPGNAMRLKRQDNGNKVNFLTSGWRNSYDNGNINFADEPEDDLYELTCPDGMSLADWNQDMSSNTNFAWNYANTPPGAEVDGGSHANLGSITFSNENPPNEGHAKSHSKSVVDNCVVPANREFVFGFYACKKLTIAPGRTSALYMIGTFIVNELENTNTSQPVHWYNVWDAKSAALVLTEFNRVAKPICATLIGKTWVDIISDDAMKNNLKQCSPMDLVTNGPNNFSWTTVDPDIGLINGNIMTSQKVLRMQRWVIREDSRSDTIR